MTQFMPESLLYKTDGNLRRVGFEIEFSGLTFDKGAGTTNHFLSLPSIWPAAGRTCLLQPGS